LNALFHTNPTKPFLGKIFCIFGFVNSSLDFALTPTRNDQEGQMRLFKTLFIISTFAGGTTFAQTAEELTLGASNCAIAKALNVKLPIECVDPPLGQTRGIVIRLDSEIRAPQKPQNILVQSAKKPTPVAQTAKSAPAPVTHKAAKSENGYFIHFALNSFDLEPEFKEHLQRLSSVLTSEAMLKTCLRVTGHTDTSGDADYNMQLSQKRAIMVATYLAEVGNIDPTRVQISAVGETEPLADISGRDPHNRRVAFSSKETETGCK
jgi:outer membrane protein OmpA-like peptidoglycan-associated protein